MYACTEWVEDAFTGREPLHEIYSRLMNPTNDVLERRLAALDGVRICGKTGTAQVTDAANRVIDHTVWFASFAPYENPRYAVVVMVESGVSGGGTVVGGGPGQAKVNQRLHHLFDGGVFIGKWGMHWLTSFALVCPQWDFKSRKSM